MSPSKTGSPDFSGTSCRKTALQTPNEGPRPRFCGDKLAPAKAGAGTQSKDKIKAETKGSRQMAGQRLNPAENSAPHQLQSGAMTNRTTERDPKVSCSIGAGASAQGTPTTTGGSLAMAIPKDFTFEAATSQQQKEGETASNPAQLINNPSLNKHTSFLRSTPNPKGPDAADKQQQQAKTTDKASVLSEKVVVAKDLIGQKGGQELMAKVVAIGNQKTTTAERPERTDTTTGSAGQKTAILNYSFPPVQRKSLDTEQNAAIGPEKSAVIAKKPIDSASYLRGDKLASAEGPRFAGIQAGGGPGRTYCKTPSEPLDSNKAKPSDNPELNVISLQISTSQSKGGGSSPTKADRFSTAASIESAAAGASSIEFERLSTLNQSANIANNTPLWPDVSKDVSEQIVESIHTCLRQADKQITVRLNPPELGQVFLRFQEREAEITGLLEVSKAEIRYEIEKALPQIIRTLTDYGVAIKRLEVHLTDQPESAPGGPGADWFEQGGSGNPPWVRQRWSEAVTDTYSYEDIGEPAQRRAEGPLWRVTNGGINVLI